MESTAMKSDFMYMNLCSSPSFWMILFLFFNPIPYVVSDNSIYNS